MDDGLEFINKVLGQWAYLNAVELDFSRPGKPTEDAFVKACNGRFRDQCLSGNRFLFLEEARKIEHS